MADTLSLVAYPSQFDSEHQYASVNSSYPTSNPIGKGSNNTTYAQINLKTGSSAETYFYYDFDLSEIPENATIISVSCSYKAIISTTNMSYINSRSVQLYSGNTAKGSSGTMTTGGTVYSLSGVDWTRSELQNARIRLYAKRGTSRTTYTYYIRFYGATLTVEYEDNTSKYTVTVQTDDGITTDKDSEYVREGESFSVKISGTVGNVTDNGTDVTSRLIEETAPPTQEVTSYPISCTTSGSISGTRYKNAIGNGSSNTESGNDYCGSSGSTATIYYAFDFSSIPSDATIESVSVTVGGHMESASNSSEVARLQLYSGNSTKGSQKSFTSTSKQLITMDSVSWTRAELQEARLAFTIGYYGGLVNGVDFVVVYSTPLNDGVYYVYTISSVTEDHIIVIAASEAEPTDSKLRIKINGTWKKVLKVYRKENGIYTEVTASSLPSDAHWVLKT